MTVSLVAARANADEALATHPLLTGTADTRAGAAPALSTPTAVAAGVYVAAAVAGAYAAGYAVGHGGTQPITK